MKFLALLLFLLAGPAFAQAPPITCDTTANYAASTTGLTQIVALNGTARIYVCSFIINVGATATNVGLSYGTGTNCASGTGVLIPPLTLPINGLVVYGRDTGNAIQTPVGNALCVSASAANPVVVSVQYSQDPGM